MRGVLWAWFYLCGVQTHDNVGANTYRVTVTDIYGQSVSDDFVVTVVAV